MLRRGINSAQHYLECKQCAGNAEYYCNTCTYNLCQVCRDRHIKSHVTRSHVIVEYQDRQATQPKTETCRVHPNMTYVMACQECKLPICIKCITDSHNGHITKRIEDALRETEKRWKDKIQTIKDVLPKLTERLKAISNYKTRSEKIHFEIRKQMREDVERVKDFLDTVLEKNLSRLDTEESLFDNEVENHLSLLTDLIDNYKNVVTCNEDEKREPYEKLIFRNDILECNVTTPAWRIPDIPTYHRETITEDDIKKFFGKLSVPRNQATENTVFRMKTSHKDSKDTSSSPVKRQEFQIPMSELRHISIHPLEADRMWFGDKSGHILFTDKLGNKLDEIKTNGEADLFGYHTVTRSGDLMYVDQSVNSIKKYALDKTITTVITTGSWRPQCVYSSDMNGDILIGMTKGSDGRVVRYNYKGHELWQSLHDVQGHNIFQSPLYISENVNGDTCTSDGASNNALVVVDKDGKHRFSYKERQDTSNVTPHGICTDDLGRILVIFGLHSIHMIDQDGQLIMVLLTRDHGMSRVFGMCVDNDNNLWVCGNNNVQIYCKCHKCFIRSSVK